MHADRRVRRTGDRLGDALVELLSVPPAGLERLNGADGPSIAR